MTALLLPLLAAASRQPHGSMPPMLTAGSPWGAETRARVEAGLRLEQETRRVAPWPSLLLEQVAAALGLRPAEAAPSAFTEVKEADSALVGAAQAQFSVPAGPDASAATTDWSADANVTEAPTCTDTPEWRNGVVRIPADIMEQALMMEANAIIGGKSLKLWDPEKGFTCDYYGYSAICINMNDLNWKETSRNDPELTHDIQLTEKATGRAPRSCMLQWEEMTGAEYGSPETNCCMCGKGQTDPRCSEEEARLYMTHHMRLMTDMHAYYGGGSLQELSMDGNPHSYFEADGMPKSNYMATLEAQGKLPPVKVTEALMGMDLHGATCSVVLGVLLLLLH